MSPGERTPSHCRLLGNCDVMTSRGCGFSPLWFDQLVKPWWEEPRPTPRIRASHVPQLAEWGGGGRASSRCDLAKRHDVTALHATGTFSPWWKVSASGSLSSQPSTQKCVLTERGPGEKGSSPSLPRPSDRARPDQPSSHPCLPRPQARILSC